VKFGTDGIRGRANVDLTAADALALGRAIATVLEGVPVVVGGDTRRSTPMLEGALVAGLAGQGAEVIRLGVVPTPMVAFSAARLGGGGAVISASHNPYFDNGIKVFGPGGLKLSDELEAEIERRCADPGPLADQPGLVSDRPAERSAYLDHLIEAVSTSSLDRYRLVVDCSHGAASPFAAELFSRLGADAVIINAEPDGVNINAGCGATDPKRLAEAVVECGASIGLAFDGDADRLIAVDERGEIVDGDRLLAIFARDLQARSALRNDTVVVTVMTNLGFHRAMEAAGIEVIQTAVGDRAVLEVLDQRSLSLGGEQSGHIIVRDRATTGDGMLSGLMLIDAIRRDGRPLSEIARGSMERLPQVLRNVALGDRRLDPGALNAVIDRVGAQATERLGGEGRVVIRPSGTEPLVRVMVEALSDEQAEGVASTVIAEITSEITNITGEPGGPTPDPPIGNI